MADKQLARSENTDFDILSDDDPLSELARIVGYDNRPAVQQLQELERHQNLMRSEPVFNLEDELLREFEIYDAPAPVAAVEAPHVSEVPVAPAPVVAAPAYEEPVFHAPEPAFDDAPVSETADPYAVDLENELELSIGYDDSLTAEPVRYVEPVAPQVAATPNLDFTFEDEPATAESDDYAVAAAAVPVPEPEPVYAPVEALRDEPVWDAPAQPVAFEPGQADFSAVEHPVIVDALPAVAAVPADNIDALLADIERFPVQPRAAAKPVLAVDSGRKSTYPFTPTFSRATPVATNAAGPSSQKAFATPLAAAPVVAKPVEVASAAAVAAPAPETLLAQDLPVEPAVVHAAPALQPEPEIEFDLNSFELDLSDIDLELDPAEFDLSTEETFADLKPEAQPLKAAPVAGFTPKAEARPVPAPAPVEIAEVYEPAVEGELPFDPSMIAESEESVAAIAELDVPQLPVIEKEEPVSYAPDYDLDIDAEMAQLFGTSQRVRPAEMTEADDQVFGGIPVSAKAGTPHVEEDFDAFERAMEEDFRRSLTPRHDDTLDQDRHAVGSGYDENSAYDDGEIRGGARRVMMFAAALVGVVVLGGAGVYAWMGDGVSALSGGDPKVILADKTPIKVVPVDKGGKTVPNQDKAVYDRVSGGGNPAPQQGALVSSNEQPMDVVQRTLTPETLPLEGENDADMAANATPVGEEDARLLPDDQSAAANGAEADKGPAVSPRKVRTMIVKPDGTLVAREDLAPAQDTQTVLADSQTEPPIKSVKTTTISPASSTAQPESALAEAAAATVDEVAPVRPVSTASVDGQAPTPVAKPVEQAAAEPVVNRAVAAEAPVQTASVPAGTYVIQIASLPTEADAKASYAKLSGKFGMIAGKGVDIRKAEIAGKGTYYRVRIPAGTRDEANALCSRYKGAGGSCLVTK